MKNTNQPNSPRLITFIHAADWQLGKPFAGITDPLKRGRVQQERIEVIRRIGTVVRDRQASFVVVAGDLFDSATPTREMISAALGAIGELGVPVFAIPGNHDHGGPDSLWEQPFFTRERDRLAPGFSLLGSRTPTVVDLPDRGDGGRNVVLLPCPLLRRHEADDPTAWIRDLDFANFDDAGDAPRIVIAHGSTASFVAGAGVGAGPSGGAGTKSGLDDRHDDDDDVARGSNIIAIDRLPIDEVDYVALGDWHGFMAAGSAAGSKTWYSGTPELDRFPKTGQEPGHVAVVTVGRGLPPSVASVRTGRFRWLTLEVALETATGDAGAAGATQGPSYLDDVLKQATLPQSPGEPGFDGCLVSVRLTGTVTLAGRVELDRVIESWQARLLRLDLDDEVQIAPSADEIHDLTARPDDPIIARVATELVSRLEAGGAVTDLNVVRHALHILHGLTQTTGPIPSPVKSPAEGRTSAAAGTDPA